MYNFDNSFKKIKEKYKTKIKPKYWGGYCRKIEFWQGRPSRFHIEFTNLMAKYES